MPSLYLRLLRYVRPYWRIFALAIFAMLITALTEPAMPALLKPLLDQGFVAHDPVMIQLLPVLLISLALIRGGATFVSNICLTWVAARLVQDLRQAMFSRLIGLPTRRFDNTAAGVLMSKFTYDVTRVMQAGTEALIVLVRDGLAVIGLLAWMLYLNWQLSLIVFAIVPLIALSVRITGRKLRRLNTALQNTMGQMTRVLEESISGHKLIKVFGGQRYEQARFGKTAQEVRQQEIDIQVASNTSMFIVQTLTATALAIVIYIATRQSVAGNVTVGDFVSLFTAMGLLLSPIKRLTKVNEHIQQGLAAAHSVFELMDEAGEPDQGRQSPARVRGAVEFRQLHFAYDQAQPVLHGIDLIVRPGETIALVGASGSGKTTLANLLPRFYPLSDGQVFLDGLDINHFKLSDLRAQIALVSQEVVLFNDTVAANIAYGAIHDRAAIIHAAQAAHAWDFIQALPAGLDSVIGERGTKLSGGQRQRLAIARALLKDAPILIFDEATSALDNESERYVQESLEHLRQGRTTFIIAHRLSSIQNADRILVMNHGKIVEMGSHHELLARQGVYAKLYQAQNVSTTAHN
jgi:ATP-binding cassette, subfamily B, bacterial MsbA